MIADIHAFRVQPCKQAWCVCKSIKQRPAFDGANSHPRDDYLELARTGALSSLPAKRHDAPVYADKERVVTQEYPRWGITVTFTLAVVVAHIFVAAEKEDTAREPLKGFFGTMHATWPSAVGALLP
jgi:hypothetical protein